MTRIHTGSPRGVAALSLLLLACLAGAGEAQAPATGERLPLEPFGYDRAAPLSYQDSLVRTVEGVQVRRFRFASPRGGQATGLLFVPPGSGRKAGVLLQHGMPADAKYMLPNGVYIARHGAVVLALDAPFARRSGPPIAIAPVDSAEQVQLIVDLQRAADVLLARRDVDAGRLAYVGRSYGGAMGALLAGVERRLRTYVLAVADGGLVTHLIGADGRGDPPGGIPPERWQAWLAAMRPIEPIRFVHRAAPASIFFQWATQDQNVRRSDAEALLRAAGDRATARWYDTGHPLNAQAHYDVLDWLHRTVSTTAPDSADAAGPDFTLRDR